MAPWWLEVAGILRLSPQLIAIERLSCVPEETFKKYIVVGMMSFSFCGALEPA